MAVEKREIKFDNNGKYLSVTTLTETLKLYFSFSTILITALFTYQINTKSNYLILFYPALIFLLLSASISLFHLSYNVGALWDKKFNLDGKFISKLQKFLWFCFIMGLIISSIFLVVSEKQKKHISTVNPSIVLEGDKLFIYNKDWTNHIEYNNDNGKIKLRIDK